MIDRTSEDIAQDKRLSDLAAKIDALRLQLGLIKTALDTLASRIQPLDGLADQMKKIQDFFASLGSKR